MPSDWHSIADVVDRWASEPVRPWERTSAEPQDTRRNLEDHDDETEIL